MADAATGFLLENLEELVRNNARLIGDAKEEVEVLIQDLNLFKGFIRDYTERRIDNPSLQALAQQIRSTVFKAEDAIDKMLVHKGISNARSFSFSSKAMRAIDDALAIRNLTKDTKSIRGQVTEIYTQNQFGFQALQKQRGPQEEKPKLPTLEEDVVVGFDEEAKTVIERLNGEDEDIITITGVAGLGKTTFARKIYNDPRIECEFLCRAWVFVSQTYSRKEIFLSILHSVSGTRDYLQEIEEVIAIKLRQHLEQVRYLIVLDDVWTKDAWDDLKIAFPRNKGSRILITSQHNQVAVNATPTKGPHNLKFLSNVESWELLEKKVFGKEKCPPGEVESLGQLIAARCGGLPLAIVVIASILLNNRQSSDWWNHVAQHVSFFIVKDQEKLLASSYNHLPYHLKSCFLYLGVFPEDYEIPVWKLILLWIAEGFIERNRWDVMMRLEDIANARVEDLINRNLLMIAQRSSSGRVKICRVHDVLLEFCKKEAQKQNLYQEIRGPNKVTLDNYRRICIHSGVEKYISSRPSGDHVRSLLCFTADEFVLPREHISMIPKGFQLLRVLEIRSITFDIFPKDLLLLVLLRYVSLSFTDKVKALPAKISTLSNMQTMIILTRSCVLELKEDMWKMNQLRHLYTNASAALPPPPSNSPETGENMQSLSRILPESCTTEVLGKTPNIRKLGVRGNIALLFEKFFESVGELKHLTNLKFYNDTYPDPPSGSKISKLPASYKFPSNLQKLTLSETLLDWYDMRELANLGKLEVLKLKDNAFKGQVWEPINGGFKSLKFLLIGRTDLVQWEALKDHFPRLVRLVLQHCDKLEAVPLALADVESFQELELYRTSNTAAASARKIKERKMLKEGQFIKTNTGGFKLGIYPPDL